MRIKIITLFVFVLSTINVFAQNSSISLFAQEGEKFWLIMDGEKQNKDAQAKVKVEKLSNPNYKVKVIFQDEKLGTIDDNLWTQGVEPGPMDVTYVIKKNSKGKYVIKVSSFKPVAASTASAPSNNQTEQTQPTNNAGNTNTTGTMSTTTTITQPNQTGMGTTTINMPGFGMNVNITDPTMGMTQQTTTTTTTNNSGYSSNTQNTTPASVAPSNNPAPKTKNCVYAMDAGAFNNAKASITKQSFAENKMQVAKQVTKANCMSAAQVKEIMGLFSFEENKLDYAKYAYEHTLDKQNYYTLNDAFSFSASVDELNSFLETK